MAYSDAHGGDLGHDKVVDLDLFATGRDATELLEFVVEALDVVAHAVES